MEKKPVNFGEGIAPFCPVCRSGEYMRNEDGNENDFCGQCGTALDWDYMYDIDQEAIVPNREDSAPVETMERVQDKAPENKCEKCNNFKPIENLSHRTLKGVCKINNPGKLRSGRQKACKKFDCRLKRL